MKRSKGPAGENGWQAVRPLGGVDQIYVVALEEVHGRKSCGRSFLHHNAQRLGNLVQVMILCGDYPWRDGFVHKVIHTFRE